MKRKITELEQKLLDNGWYLANKRYTGKRSEKTLCYEYQKTSDLRNDNKVYDLFINLDLKRSQIVKYGVANLFMERMGSEELMIVRFLFLELKHYVERVTTYKDAMEYSKVVVKDICDEEKQKMLNSLNEPHKILVVPNSELDERQELGAMTPEQFDELCKENEDAKGS